MPIEWLPWSPAARVLGRRAHDPVDLARVQPRRVLRSRSDHTRPRKYPSFVRIAAAPRE